MTELVDRCLLLGFEGRTAPDRIRRLAAAGLGGVILFADNLGEPEEIAGLVAALRSERPELLVALDEEGGTVTRLEARHGSSFPDALTLGTVDDVELTREVARSVAGALAKVGANLNLAPVVDVNSDPANPVIGVRSFGADPRRVAAHGVAFVEGTQERGVGACAKHFPGHGDTTVDSHFGLPRIGRGLEQLREVELVPFRAVIEAGVEAIMTAHVHFTALDEAPATLSRPILTGLLREELGFGGAVVTDALEMEAIAGSVGVARGAVRSLQAGADLLCIGREAPQEDARLALQEAMRDGTLATERLEEAAGRVDRLALAARTPAAGEVDRHLGVEAARRAVSVAGEIRLAAPPVVIELLSGRGAGIGGASGSLLDELRVREPAVDGERLDAPPPDVDELLARAEGRPLVVSAEEPHRYPWQRDVLQRVRTGRPEAIVVAFGVPDPQPLDPPVLTAHGSARVAVAAAAERLLRP
ncbi:MAG: glycoside hydrolase family 3 protein [Actinobacteria bacterium]|nr:glycoside hydrolase family 3 protein [Actinomycetota bacterium]